MTLTVLVTGGQGRLAQALIRNNTHFHLIAPEKNELDITDLSTIESAVTRYRPDIIIHAAALTNPLSEHDKSPIKSIQTNIIGSANMAMVAEKHHIKLVYISTDYVYPFNSEAAKESDPLLPFSAYGWSKLGGECAARMLKNALIIRLSFSETPYPHPRAYDNMIKNLLPIDEAAHCILQLLNHSGVINIGADESVSLYEFAKRSRPDVIPVSNTDENTPTIQTLNITKMKGLCHDKHR